MSAQRITREDCVGLLRPVMDAHTLGVMSLAQLLEACGCRCVLANGLICSALVAPDQPANLERIAGWLTDHKVTVLGFSYRLDPQDGARLAGRLAHGLKTRRLLEAQGGRIRTLCFAGLPEACALVRKYCPEYTVVFEGDETPTETLVRLGVDTAVIPRDVSAGVRYDEDRLAFGRDLIRRGGHLAVKPVDRSGYPEFGTRQDTLVARLRHGAGQSLPPLMRAHMGPYLANRDEAVALFFRWCRQAAAAGFLDVLSIGSSQLTQSDFGADWTGKPNGGGVPLNSAEEFAEAWRASRPMLVRTYAGTRNIPDLARMYEETLNMAWHALSLWWFCRIDGRGPYAVRENLVQHLETLRYIASTGKPWEANVPHHFAFRGADDVTYVVSAVLAARVAKAQGIRQFILQNMLNTPKYTWGVQDLAKARALLRLVRELEDSRFQVILQPRGGLDYFSHDTEKAKAQLAAVTALMDDIEPNEPASPPLIHVVSYSEGSHLADPSIIDESIQITRHALQEYRSLRRRGEVDNMAEHPDVAGRTAELLSEARIVLRAIDAGVPDPCSAAGLYRILERGFLTAPYLWECREEFRNARKWQTRLVKGSVKVVNDEGVPIGAAERMQQILAADGGIRSGHGGGVS